MSDAYAVRSYGQPYFAALVESLDNMDAAFCIREHNSGGFSFGSLTMGLEFSIESLPVKRSSDDESHPLFAYADYYPGTVGDMASVGVTPNGRLIANVMNAAALQSAPGLVVPGTRYRAELQCNRSSTTDGVDILVLRDPVTDGTLYSSGGVIRARDLIVPFANSRFILFNGVRATTRCACTIYNALMQGTDIDSDLVSAEWPIEDREGSTLIWTAPEDLPPNPLPDDGVAQNYNMRIQSYVPLFWPALYGTAADYRAGFAWQLMTPWTKRVPPATVWHRTAA